MTPVLFLIAMLGLTTAGWAQDTATPGEQASLVWDTDDAVRARTWGQLKNH